MTQYNDIHSTFVMHFASLKSILEEHVKDFKCYWI